MGETSQEITIPASPQANLTLDLFNSLPQNTNYD